MGRVRKSFAPEIMLIITVEEKNLFATVSDDISTLTATGGTVTLSLPVDKVTDKSWSRIVKIMFNYKWKKIDIINLNLSTVRLKEVKEFITINNLPIVVKELPQ